MKKFYTIAIILQLAIGVALLVGEVKCVIKAINCNWDPIGKAEVIYTAAACTGLGCIVGYFNIEDN